MSSPAIKKAWLHRRIFSWLIPGLLAVLACGLVLVLHRAAEERAEDAGAERAAQAAAVLGGEVRRDNGVVAGLRLLFNVDTPEAREAARRLGPSLVENTGVLALAYAPRVPAGGRESFERQAGGRISDLTPSGDLVPSPPRRVYFPALVVAPSAQKRLLGLDAYSVPTLARAVDQAITTGRTQVASIEGLLPDGIYVLVQPVYHGRPAASAAARRAAATGVVLGGFPVSTLEQVLADSLGAATPFRIILDGRPIGGEGALGASSSAQISAAGGTWTVAVARPAIDHTPALVAALACVGLVLLVSALFAQIARVERERESATVAADQASSERDRSRSLISSLQEGLVLLDAEGRVDSGNDRFCRMTGTTQAGIVGHELADFLAVPSPARSALIREQVREGDGTDHDHRLAGPEGTSFPALVSLAPFQGPDGQRIGTVCTIKDISERKRAEDELRDSEAAYRSLAVEQGAFRRVATAVAETPDPEHIYPLVAEEAARMLDAEASWVIRLEEGSDQIRFLGMYGIEPSEHLGSGGRVGIDPGWPIAELVRTGHVARRRVDVAQSDANAFRHSIIAPIRVSGRLWGGLEIARNGAVFPPASDERLARVAELLATAVSNAESRAQLASQASRDPLTDLANHRAFWEHLRRECEHARRYGLPLSLVLLDIDHFKQVNDLHGHQAGDRALTETARLLRGLAREGELVARTGGEEFAWVLPATDGRGAIAAAERARQVVAAAAIAEVGRISLSAGVCDLAQAADVSELYTLADGALYWAKSHGRGQSVRYDPAVVKALSAEERRQNAERERVLTGLAAMARAVDARDQSTLEHSERVAALSERIALGIGWSAETAGRLREAALIHDLGKVGVPDSILLKPSALSEAERRQVEGHVELSVMIAADVLDADQARWVRGHHERWDGAGYPDGLAGSAIPEGARILALADAWDVITSVRTYKEAASPEEALTECRRSAGAHFEPRLVEALAALLEAGPEPDHPERRSTDRRRTDPPAAPGPAQQA